MCRTASARRPGRYFISRVLPQPSGLESFAVQPVVPGPVFPGAMVRCVHRPPAGMSRPIRPQGDKPDMRSTPHNFTSTDAIRACCRPVLAPWKSACQGRQALIPLPSSGLAECSFARPFGECRRDANSLAPNGSKARTLQSARQELVRVPESNTKYGGLRGITGGKPAPVLEASISESSGIPNRKNLPFVVPGTLHPAVHRAGIFLSNGLASAGLT